MLLPGGEYHDHLPAFQLRLKLDLRDRDGLFLDLCQKLHSEFLMRHFASPEAERHLYFVALLEKLFHRTHLNFVVMRVDIRAKLDFLDLDGLLLLTRLRSLLLGHELIFPEIHDLADWDFAIHRDLNEIQTGFLGSGQRVALGDGSMVFPSLVDELDIAGNNSFINARPFLSRRASYRMAYLTLL
jgi:hypothetical protein